jgi:hypothetical protein
MVTGMFWCWLNELSMKLESRVRLEFITVQTANLVFEAGLPGSLAQAGTMWLNTSAHGHKSRRPRERRQGG